MKLYKARVSNGTIETINPRSVAEDWYMAKYPGGRVGRFPMKTPNSKCFTERKEARDWLVTKLTIEVENQRSNLCILEQRLKDAQRW